MRQMCSVCNHRPAKAIVTKGPRANHGRKYIQRKGHDLCRQCYRSMWTPINQVQEEERAVERMERYQKMLDSTA